MGPSLGEDTQCYRRGLGLLGGLGQCTTKEQHGRMSLRHWQNLYANDRTCELAMEPVGRDDADFAEISGARNTHKLNLARFLIHGLSPG